MGQELLLRKATGLHASTDFTEGAGKMTRTQADRFIDMTINNSVMFQEGLARTIVIDHRKGRILRLKFGEPVTYGAEEGEEVTRLVKPENSWLDYDTRKLASAMDMNTEVEELNVEGRGYNDTLMQALATQMGNDFEHVAIMGDTVKYINDTDATGRLLKTMDGWHKQSAAAHIFDAEGATISKVIFSEMIRLMPNYYKQRRNELRFFASPSIVQDWRDQLASRNTQLGDDSLVGSGPLNAFAIPLVEVPLIPDNLNSYDGSTAYGNASWIWLTFPENFTRFISREIETYREFKPRFDKWEWTAYTYQGMFLQNVDAMVMATNIRTQGAN